MKIRTLKLINFKNHEQVQLDFKKPIVSLVGMNGSGKTNILDAIYLLGNTKSAFSSSENQNIKQGERYYLAEGSFHDSGETSQIKSYLEQNQKRIFKCDDLDYERVSDHIGKIPVVLSCPFDTDIIRDSSETRRKWIDGCISILDSKYLANLIGFQRVLRQRNSLLKQMSGVGNASEMALLDTYDDQVITHSISISKDRAEFIKEFQQYFHPNLKALVSDLEHCNIEFRSRTLDDGFESDFRNTREKDIITQRTNLGSHRDEIIFKIEGNPIKKFGSQGQQKSFLISLRLAQFDYIATNKRVIPILLLDDIFDKLDDSRISNLIGILKDEERFDQVIITDARKERTKSFFEGVDDLEMIEVDKLHDK